MVKNIEFKNVKNESQEKLKVEVNEIKSSDKIFVAADKSKHTYKMEKQQYTKLLQKTLQKLHKENN